jgi:phosphoadenosine phosphosulfate reductase
MSSAVVRVTLVDQALSLIASEIARASAPCVTSSFQADGVVLLHLLRQIRPAIPVLFLDTFHHFDVTMQYRDELVAAWDLNLVTLSAEEPAPGLWRVSTDACCRRHKVEPLFAALRAYDTWFAGLRRDQSRSRADLDEIAPFTLPDGSVLRKVSPLARWTKEDVQEYARMHAIPLLPLYERGYTSIGCEPCTSVPNDAADERSGRWGGQKLECGIHIQRRDKRNAAISSPLRTSSTSPAITG